jgi:hypothetical protein
VRRGVAQLEAVAPVPRRLHVVLPVVEDAEPVEAAAQRGEHHVCRVLDPVDAADLVAVVGRDGDLGHPEPGHQELDDDLRVEVEDVRIALERQRTERRHPVGAESRVELRQARTQHPVLEPGEDLVADELVERHAAAPRRAGDQHPRAEHRVSGAIKERPEQVGDAFRGVLAVPVQQHHEVEPVADRVGVAEFLVAAVALVAGVVEDRDGVPDLLGREQAHLEGAVPRAVVDDEHLGVQLPDARGNALQHAAQGRLGLVRDDEDQQPRRRPARGFSHVCLLWHTEVHWSPHAWRGAPDCHCASP